MPRQSARFLAATLLAGGLIGCARRAAPPSTPPPAPVAPPAPSSASQPAAPPKPTAMGDVHEKVASQILTALSDHDFDAVERQFNDRMRQDVPKEKISRVWSGAVAANGELLSWKLVTRDDHKDYDQLRYELKLENGRVEALVTFGPKGSKVAGLFIRQLSNR